MISINIFGFMVETWLLGVMLLSLVMLFFYVIILAMGLHAVFLHILILKKKTDLVWEIPLHIFSVLFFLWSSLQIVTSFPLRSLAPLVFMLWVAIGILFNWVILSAIEHDAKRFYLIYEDEWKQSWKFPFVRLERDY